FRRLCSRCLGSSGWRGMAPDEFARESSVGFRSSSTRSVLQNRFSEAGSLAQANTPRYHRLVNAFTEMLAHFGYDLFAKVRPAVEHRHNDTAKFEARVGA